jgi:hypothetical protein
MVHSWEQPRLLPGPLACLAAHLAAQPQAQAGLMSWAVYDDEDLAVFAAHLQPALEQALGRAFDPQWVLSLDQWGQALFACTHKNLPREELFDVFGKADVFLALARHDPRWAHRRVTLFDDAFDDMTLVVPTRGTIARIVKVDPLLGFKDPGVLGA